MIRRLLRAVFYTGQHHVHTAQRDQHGALVTFSTVAARLRREAMANVRIDIVPEVSGFSADVRRALIGMFDNPERFAPEQLGAMSV